MARKLLMGLGFTLALLGSFSGLARADVPPPSGQPYVRPLRPTPTPVPDSCQFVGGFKALHDAIPDVVGDCQADQAFDENGDAWQPTWAGFAGDRNDPNLIANKPATLLIWHKADNWTGFADGTHVWVLGPSGVEQRLNNQRFAWESDAARHEIVPDAPFTP